jgi:uncharacterized membrane protein (UPF0127 family)
MLRSFILQERPEDRRRNRLVILGFIAFVFIISYIIYGSVAYGLSKITMYYPGDDGYTPPVRLRTIEVVCADKNIFKTYVANNESDREKGLSILKKINSDESMIFIFDTPMRYAFWMKDMKFPIDIVWLDENKKIVDIKSDVSPRTYPEAFAPDSESLYVMEFKAGTSKKINIKIGDICNFDFSILK